MMLVVLDILSLALAVAGSFFLLTGSIGLLRMPDFYTRVHASSLMDSLGAILILAALGIHAGLNEATLRVVLILILFLVTGPAAIHAMCKTARHHSHTDEIEE